MSFAFTRSCKTSLTLSNSTVEINASPSAFFCFSIIELNPPMVSRSSPLMEPLRSKIKTISVKFFLMCLSSQNISPCRVRCYGIHYSRQIAACFHTLQPYYSSFILKSGRMESDILFSRPNQALVKGK